MAAAREFNIGKDTLVDFLVSKGFNKDDLKPTSKLTEDMYRALQMEFQSDKAAKMKSEQIDLPKGATAEARKKKDEEEIVFRKEKEEKKRKEIKRNKRKKKKHLAKKVAKKKKKTKTRTKTKTKTKKKT